MLANPHHTTLHHRAPLPTNQSVQRAEGTESALEWQLAASLPVRLTQLLLPLMLLKRLLLVRLRLLILRLTQLLLPLMLLKRLLLVRLRLLIRFRGGLRLRGPERPTPR